MLSELAVGIEDYFESIENYLIDIEKTGIGSKDAVDNIFRVFHNIKGGIAAMWVLLHGEVCSPCGEYAG